MAQPYDVTFNLTAKSVVVQAQGTSVEQGYEVLGTVDRPAPGEVDSPKEVLFHKVRDMLYHQGVKDMAAVTIRVKQTQDDNDMAFVPEQARRNFKPSGTQEPGQVNEVKDDTNSPVDAPMTQEQYDAQKPAEPNAEDTLTLGVGETHQLDAGKDARFESSDDAIVSVDEAGMLRGQAVGEALVAVAEADETKTFAVKVVKSN